MKINIEEISDKSVDEMIELMKTDYFANIVKSDPTFAIIVEHSKIILKNYHLKLTEELKSKGIEI